MILMFLSTRGASATLAATCASVLLLAAAGCGPDQSGSGDSSGSSGKLRIVAAFYPLQFATDRVVGSHASVVNLTRPGAEPHDLELTPRDVANLEEASLVIHLHGLQPAVDDAVATGASDHELD